MVHANSSEAGSKEDASSEPPEKSQVPAIIFSGVLLILWLVVLRDAEQFVGPIVQLLEWFELRLGMDILPGSSA